MYDLSLSNSSFAENATEHDEGPLERTANPNSYNKWNEYKSPNYETLRDEYYKYSLKYERAMDSKPNN